MNNICKVCDQTIQIMCRKGTGICSELCEKGAEKLLKQGEIKVHDISMNGHGPINSIERKVS